MRFLFKIFIGGSFMLLFWVPFLCYSQGEDEFPKLPLDEHTGLIKFEEVITVGEADKNELYVRAISWFDKFYNTKDITIVRKSYYKNPTNVIQEMDPIKGVLTGEAMFKLTDKENVTKETASKQEPATKTPNTPTPAQKAGNPAGGKDSKAKNPPAAPEEKKSTAGLIKYTVKILFKDGKYKYTITNIRLDRAGYYGIEKWYNKADTDKKINIENLKQVDAYFKELIKNLQLVMQISTKVPQEDEW